MPNDQGTQPPADDKPLADWQCGARTRSGGKCRQKKINGTARCKQHGGQAPQAIAAAQRRAAIEDMRAAALSRGSFGYGLDIEVSPSEAIKQELHRTAAAVHWLSLIVADLDRDRITVGTTKIENRTGFQAGRSTTVETKPSVWYELWLKERSHFAKVADIAHRMGIDERQTQVIEQAAQLGVIAIARILEKLELTSTQQELAGTVVPQVLRSISGTVDLAQDSEEGQTA
jgi:hypothetical protein